MRGLGSSPRRALTGAAVLALVFAIVTALSYLLGAKNLGTAMTFGQIAFAAALVAILTMRE